MSQNKQRENKNTNTQRNTAQKNKHTDMKCQGPKMSQKKTEGKQKHKHTEEHNTKHKHTDMKGQGAKMSHARVKLTEGNQTHTKQTNKIEEYFVSNTRVLQKDNF